MATAARKSGGAASKSAKGTTRRTTRNTPSLSKDEEFQAYRDMLLIRRFEEKSGQMYGIGADFGVFCHLYIGQEAVVVGMQMASEGPGSGDHGDTAELSAWPGGSRAHARTGMDPKGVLAELTAGARAAIPRGRAARCTCSPRKSTSMAAMASSARRSRSALSGHPALRKPVSRRGQSSA